MIDDRLQFALTQYLDGELPAPEQAALEARLASDPEALALLEEYRRLDNLLQSAPPLPAIDWDRLAEHLSDTVARQENSRRLSIRPADDPAPAGIFRLFFAAPRFAVAASLLLVAGLALLAYRSASRPAAPTSVASMDIRVLQTDPASGVAVVNVAIGPADTHQASDTLVEGVVYRPSVVMIESGRQRARY